MCIGFNQMSGQFVTGICHGFFGELSVIDENGKSTIDRALRGEGGERKSGLEDGLETEGGLIGCIDRVC